jgi:hypothetical protein
MANQLQQLTEAGQIIWLDNIERSMFASDELRRLIRFGSPWNDLESVDLREGH